VACHRPPLPRDGTVLSLCGVTKSYGVVCAVRELDLAVESGAIVGLVGPNGSGKTTILHIAAGLVRADVGSANVAGVAAGSTVARQQCVLVADDVGGLDELEVGELATLTRALWATPGATCPRTDLLLSAFDLTESTQARLGDLSRGRRRQAFIVALLALAPALVLVDEATATLDPEAVLVLREALCGLAVRGTAVLLATQDLHFAASACDRLVVLDRGVVRAQGSPASLCGRAGVATLEEAFLVLSGARRAGACLRHDLAAL
jgi:ABC-2 type transport system ATP-binding protein